MSSASGGTHLISRRCHQRTPACVRCKQAEQAQKQLHVHEEKLRKCAFGASSQLRLFQCYPVDLCQHLQYCAS
jgi:hypothetical protein